MKNIAKFLLLTAAIFLSASCAREEFSTPEGDSLVFTAKIGDATRTALDATTAGKVNWVAGDEISINGVVYVATPDASDASRATFTKKNEADADPELIDGQYYATYGCSYDALTGEGVIPAKQTYSAGILNAPMFAESGTTSLSFNNICGVIEFRLKGETAVTGISVTSEEYGMAGTFVTYDGQCATILSNEEPTATLDCGEGVALSSTEATSFCVAVPEGNYTDLQITIFCADGGRMILTRESATEILANGLYSLPLTVVSKKDETAILPAGIVFNTTLKKLVADDPAAITSETVVDKKIKTIAFVTEDSSTEGTEIQDSKSGNKIYVKANADKSVVTVSTPAKVLYMNEDASSMFAYLCSLEGFDNLAAVNTSKTTNMSKMFYFNNEINTAVVTGNLALKELDLSSFNTSNVTNFASMFNTAWNLEKVNLSSFDTKNAIYMNHMFCNCNALKSVDLSKFNTSNVTTMTYMFYHCWGLTELDLSSFDTQKVTTFSYMFYYCKNLLKLDVSSFKTPVATTCANMFNSCYKVKMLDLSGFDGSKFTVTTISSGERVITGVSSMMNQLGALEELWLNPNFGSKPNTVYTNFLVVAKTQTAANNRTCLCNTTGKLIIHTTQNIADWATGVGAFRWVKFGTEGQPTVDIQFVDMVTGEPLSATW